MEFRFLKPPFFVFFALGFFTTMARAEPLKSYRDPDSGLVWFDDLQLHSELAPYLLNSEADGQSWGEVEGVDSGAERLITFDRPSFLGGEGDYAPFLDIQFMRISPKTSGVYLQDEATGSGWPDNRTTYARFLSSQSPFEIKHSQDLPFDLLSLDVSEYSTTLPNRVSLQFVGYLAGGGTVSHNLVTDGIFDGGGPLADFQTVTLPATFRNLSRVTVNMNSGGHIDNVRVMVLGQEILPPPSPPLPLLYDIDWNDWPHRVNASTGLGGAYAPKSINFGDPIVRQAIGAMTDQPLELKLGNGTPVQGSSAYEQFKIGISRRAESYFFECDVMIAAHGPDSTLDRFAIHFDGAGVHSLNFNSNGAINLFKSGLLGGGNIGTFSLNEVVRIGVRLDMVKGRIEVLKNGVRIHESASGFNGLDLRDVRVHFSDSSMGNALAAIDNLKIYGYGIPAETGPNGPLLTSSPASLFFAPTETGATSFKSLRLTNSGDTVLNVGSVVSTNGAYTVPGNFPVDIDPGDSLSLQVMFSPVVPGTQTGSLQVLSNAPHSPRILPLSGLAVSGETFRLSRQIFEEIISPDALAYAEFTITNNRVSPLTWTLEREGGNGGGGVAGTPVVPNDNSIGQLWGHRSPSTTTGGIDSFLAWSVTTGSSSVKVAVIDTGVDLSHPDLAANIWTNPGEIAGNGVDDDGNGFTDDVRGWDFAYDDNLPSDIHGHGTHVAGTIAAKGNNGVGVAGVAWSAAIIPVKFLSDTGPGYTSDAIEAIDYATRMGARLSNNSWGGGGYSGALRSAIQRAAAGNSLFVAAAGNNGSNNDDSPHYPSSYDNLNILSVAATTTSDKLANFSNYGLSSVDLSAPGEGIYSTYPGNRYRSLSGTSMATPQVAGAAILILAQDPTLGWLALRSRLVDSADRIPALESRIPNGGRLNAANALEMAPAPWLTISNPAGTIPSGGSAVVRLDLDSGNLRLGQYFQTLRFSTNDPANPLIELPFTLAVSDDLPSGPAIITHPQSLSRIIGGSAILSVVASGEDLTYRWYEGLPGNTTNPVGAGLSSLSVTNLNTVGVRRFWVRVNNAHGVADSSGATITVSYAAAGLPTGLSATSGTYSDKVVVSWGAATNATSYTLRRGLSNLYSSSVVIASGLTGTTRNDTNAATGVTYYYWVLAGGPGGSSAAVGPVTGRLRLAPPQAPTSFSAGKGISSVEIALTWTSAPTATKYTVYRSTEANYPTASLLWTGSATQMLDRSAISNQNYYYWVVSGNAEAESAVKGPELGYLRNPLPTPFGLSATSESHGRVSLKWNAVAGANSYHVFRSIPGRSNLERIGISPTTAFEDDSADPGVIYRYSVRAFAEVGSGELSNYSTAVSGEAGFFKVDLAVGSSPSALSGGGIIDAGGSLQTLVFRSKRMRPASYHCRVSNRGNVATIARLTSPPASRMFRVTQMQVAPVTENLTAALMVGGSIVSLPGGGSVAIQSTVSPSPAAKRKKSKSLKYLSWIRGEVIESPGIQDTVRVQASFQK